MNLYPLWSDKDFCVFVRLVIVLSLFLIDALPSFGDILQGKGIDWRAADSLDNPIPAVIDHKNPVPCEVMVNRELCNSAKVTNCQRTRMMHHF